MNRSRALWLRLGLLLVAIVAAAFVSVAVLLPMTETKLEAFGLGVALVSVARMLTDVIAEVKL